MKQYLIFLLVSILFISGCTYHGQVRRNIYKESDRTPAIHASVLVRANQHVPQELLITDTENSDMQSFLLKIREGVTSAVVDALRGLFQTVQEENFSAQQPYDYMAEVALESGLTRNNCEGELAKWAVRKDGLCTMVTLTFYRAEGEKLTSVKASAWREFRTPGFASSVRWVNKHTYIFSPVLTPVYMQAQGTTLRNQFEANLTETLDDILSTLQQQRMLFEPAANNKMPETAQNYVE